MDFNGFFGAMLLTGSQQGRDALETSGYDRSWLYQQARNKFNENDWKALNTIWRQYNDSFTEMWIASELSLARKEAAIDGTTLDENAVTENARAEAQDLIRNEVGAEMTNEAGVQLSGGHIVPAYRSEGANDPRKFYRNFGHELKSRVSELSKPEKENRNLVVSFNASINTIKKRVIMTKMYPTVSEIQHFFENKETREDFRELMGNEWYDVFRETAYNQTVNKTLPGMTGQDILEYANAIARNGIALKWIAGDIGNAMEGFSQAVPILNNFMPVQRLLTDGLSREDGRQTWITYQRNLYKRDWFVNMKSHARGDENPEHAATNSMLQLALTKSPLLQTRIRNESLVAAEMERNLQGLRSRRRGIKRHFASMAHFGFTIHRLIDMPQAVAMWNAVYTNQVRIIARDNPGMDSERIEREAINKAERAVARTVGGVSSLHVGNFFNENRNEYLRTLSLFARFANAVMYQYWRQETRAARIRYREEGLTAGTVGAFTLSSTHAMLRMMFMSWTGHILRSGFDDDEETFNNWREQMIKGDLLGAADAFAFEWERMDPTFPFVGTSIVSEALLLSFSPGGIPAIEEFRNIVSGFEMILTGEAFEDWEKGLKAFEATPITMIVPYLNGISEGIREIAFEQTQNHSDILDIPFAFIEGTDKK